MSSCRPASRTLLRCCAALLFLLPALPVGPAAAADQDLPAAIDRLTDAVNRLVQMQQSGSAIAGSDDQLRRLSLAVAYLDYRSRRIEAFEQEMSENRSYMERIDDMVRQIERREAALEESQRNNPQMTGAEADETRKELSGQKKLLLERAARIDGKLIQLENEAAALKAELVPIERYIQSNLNF